MYTSLMATGAASWIGSKVIPFSTASPTTLSSLRVQKNALRFDSKKLTIINMGLSKIAASSLSVEDLPARKRPGEKKGFVEEMRFVAMKLHTRDQSKEGEKEADVQPVGSLKPSIQGYLKFLVDSKAVYDTLESIVAESKNPLYDVFLNTGLERSAALAKDLEWFKNKGHEIPEAGVDAKAYADYLVEISEKDPPSFICHFYNIYFAHTAGGRIIGNKISNELLEGKTLEFYKYEGELRQLLADVKTKLNQVAEGWTREEKDRCLEETEKSFKLSGKLLRLIWSE